MPESTSSPIRFAAAPRPLTASFDLDALTSDGGLVWLREADEALALSTTLAAQIPDWRTRPGRHALGTLVQQRLYQIACGYADQNDATTLRHDPLLKQVCGRLPITGSALASQPTLSRLENAVDTKTCYRLAVALVEVYLRERERGGTPQRILLIWTAPPTRSMGTRKVAPIMGTSANTCTIHWSSMMVRPTNSLRRCSGPATVTPVVGLSASFGD